MTGIKIGIDLGTSLSSVSLLKEDGSVEVLKNLDGEILTPSVVHYDGGIFTVGKKAKVLLKQGNENTTGSFKINMGSVQKYKLAGTEFSPKELSAEILRYLKDSALKATGGEIGTCVVTVPAYYSELQRREVREAGELAGLKIDRIINEPTSASLAYGIDLTEEKTILTYDLGGGTFDISLLTVGDGVVEVIGTKGDNHLGGDNFDQDLASVILRTLKKLYKYQPSNPNVIKALAEIAKSAKEALSTEESYTLDLSVLETIDSKFTQPAEPIVVNQADFARIISKHIIKTVNLTKETVEEADMELTDVDKIILVGGSTRIPMVKEMLEKVTGLEVLSGAVDPDLAVSVGAAIQTGILTGDNKDMVLLDVTPFDLSVETVDGLASRLVKANSTIPISRSRVYTTSYDNQSEIEFDIFQGNKPIARENEFLGRLTLNDIKPAKKGIPQIEVTFKIDENGELEVTATDIMTAKSMTIKRSIS